MQTKTMSSGPLWPPRLSAEPSECRARLRPADAKPRRLPVNEKGLAAQGAVLAWRKQNQNLPEGTWGIPARSSRPQSSQASVLSLSRCFRKTELAFSER